MQENVAATVLRLSGWDGSQPLFDPFCGSGTLLMEAAMKQTRLPAARFRSKFGFLRLPDFDATLWNQIKTEANRAVTPLPEYLICGSDIDVAAIQAAATHIAMLPEGKISNSKSKTSDPLHHSIITVLSPILPMESEWNHLNKPNFYSKNLVIFLNKNVRDQLPLSILVNPPSVKNLV